MRFKPNFSFDNFMSGVNDEDTFKETKSESNSVDDFLNSASNTPKQEYSYDDAPPRPESDQPDEIKIEGSEKPEGVRLESTVKSRNGAEMLVHTFDFIFSKSAQFFANTETSKEWKSDEDETKEMIEAWDRYLQTLSGEIPAWVGVVIVVTLVYGLKVPKIIKVRKSNIDQKEREERDQQLREMREKAANQVMQKENIEPEFHNEQQNSGEVIKNCLECGKELLAHQILRGGTFCGVAHGNQYRARMQKQKRKSENNE